MDDASLSTKVSIAAQRFSRTLIVIAITITAADVADFIRSLLPEHQISMYNLSGRKSTIAGNWYYGTSIFLSNMCILSGCTML